MTALATEAVRLPPSERLRLIQEVWESLAASPEQIPTSSDQLHELEERRKRYRANPESLVDWEELKEKIRERRRHAH